MLRGNEKLPQANLLKREQLRKNPVIAVAVQQPRVRAGELVEKKEQGKISHFSAGEYTERGRRVKALRYAATAGAARLERAAWTRLPLRSCDASSQEKMGEEMGTEGKVRSVRRFAPGGVVTLHP